MQQLLQAMPALQQLSNIQHAASHYLDGLKGMSKARIECCGILNILDDHITLHFDHGVVRPPERLV